ncbi:hypothetical protein [Corynebacterium bovis]|uniref:Uncharacterized protein n=3 Tax=Corynebacterium bovis TaxID=36808 RepID=A0A8I0CPF0_9CORY|nr:hypothetical protein [Corynebacterium bovis]MBB3115906.1 hypothetical protein [Corynebacterium bovis DSM 20582 = CIP 54.80]QQC46868.1 hypothetical protein I6I09_07060 [Corynebacterium bovis]RRO80394.1 hypothetical protein CXF38_06745 [Corynebacterium bovis]RRO82455.1 hypothetical protein CXF36_05580 [Corynebacterium bovis]RRO92351.1 hypothetical protein CXF45_01615 [Corynebacterium bovis]
MAGFGWFGRGRRARGAEGDDAPRGGAQVGDRGRGRGGAGAEPWSTPGAEDIVARWRAVAEAVSVRTYAAAVLTGRLTGVGATALAGELRDLSARALDGGHHGLAYRIDLTRLTLLVSVGDREAVGLLYRLWEAYVGNPGTFPAHHDALATGGRTSVTDSPVDGDGEPLPHLYHSVWDDLAHAAAADPSYPLEEAERLLEDGENALRHLGVSPDELTGRRVSLLTALGRIPEATRLAAARELTSDLDISPQAPVASVIRRYREVASRTDLALRAGDGDRVAELVAYAEAMPSVGDWPGCLTAPMLRATAATVPAELTAQRVGRMLTFELGDPGRTAVVAGAAAYLAQAVDVDVALSLVERLLPLMLLDPDRRVVDVDALLEPVLVSAVAAGAGDVRLPRLGLPEFEGVIGRVDPTVADLHHVVTSRCDARREALDRRNGTDAHRTAPRTWPVPPLAADHVAQLRLDRIPALTTACPAGFTAESFTVPPDAARDGEPVDVDAIADADLPAALMCFRIAGDDDRAAAALARVRARALPGTWESAVLVVDRVVTSGTFDVDPVLEAVQELSGAPGGIGAGHGAGSAVTGATGVGESTETTMWAAGDVTAGVAAQGADATAAGGRHRKPDVVDPDEWQAMLTDTTLDDHDVASAILHQMHPQAGRDRRDAGAPGATPEEAAGAVAGLAGFLTLCDAVTRFPGAAATPADRAAALSDIADRWRALPEPAKPLAEVYILLCTRFPAMEGTGAGTERVVPASAETVAFAVRALPIVMRCAPRFALHRLSLIVDEPPAGQDPQLTDALTGMFTDALLGWPLGVVDLTRLDIGARWAARRHRVLDAVGITWRYLALVDRRLRLLGDAPDDDARRETLRAVQAEHAVMLSRAYGALDSVVCAAASGRKAAGLAVATGDPQIIAEARSNELKALVTAGIDNEAWDLAVELMGWGFPDQPHHEWLIAVYSVHASIHAALAGLYDPEGRWAVLWSNFSATMRSAAERYRDTSPDVATLDEINEESEKLLNELMDASLSREADEIARWRRGLVTPTAEDILRDPRATAHDREEAHRLLHWVMFSEGFTAQMLDDIDRSCRTYAETYHRAAADGNTYIADGVLRELDRLTGVYRDEPEAAAAFHRTLLALREG